MGCGVGGVGCSAFPVVLSVLVYGFGYLSGFGLGFRVLVISSMVLFSVGLVKYAFM